MPIQLKTLQEIREETPGLKHAGNWLVINVELRIPWPTVAQSFEFEDHEIWLIPITEAAYPGLAVRNPQVDRDAAYAMLYRALSVICWLEDGGATVEGRGGGSPYFPQYGVRNRANTVLQDTFDLTRLPVVQTDDARLALALMREGRGLNHPAYSFLSFYRVIERAIPNGTARGRWMSEAVERLQSHQARESLSKLRETYHGDVGRHLYDSGRSAVAHATKDPVANPDDPRDYQRLYRERPIIEALAVMAIEEFFGVQTSHTIWLEHLYELRGWKPIVSEEMRAVVAMGEQPNPDEVLDIPRINIRLRRTGIYDALEGMEPVGWGVVDGKFQVDFRSKNGLLHATLLLNFVEERLEFDPGTNLRLSDDGSLAAAQTGKWLQRFFNDYILNGELQVWNAEDGSLMSRCDPYVPVNVMFNPEGAKAAIDRWDAEIVRRAMRPADR